MPMINIDDAYILGETGAQVDKVTGLFTKDEETTSGEKAFAQLNIGTAGSNRNFFDNPWFTINQRGQNSYSANSYGVDRWVVTSNASINVLSNGIELTTTANRWGLEQRCVKNLIPHGTTVTLSALIDDGEIVQGSFVWNGANVNLYPDGADVGFEINTAPTAYDKLYVCNKAASTHIIHAVKLETGSFSTLLNDAPPDYGEELRKCMRYFVRLQGLYAFVGSGWCTNTTTAWISAPLPVPMRATPTVSFTGLYLVSSSYFSVSALTVLGNSAMTASNLSLRATASGLTTDTPCIAQFRDSGAYIDLSADL